jgi:MOSC domain-containing protein
MGTVAEVWRYPVKSLQGERLSTARLGAHGLEGDRGLALFDAAGTLLTGRHDARLLTAAARLEGGEVVVTLPDGTELGPGPDRDARLSRWLGYLVALRPAPEAEPFVDLSPVHLVTRASLGSWDVRRFRPTLLADGELGAEVEVGEALLAVDEPMRRCVMTTLAQPGLPRDRAVLRAIARERDNILGVQARVLRPGQVSVGDALSVRRSASRLTP